MAERLVRRRSQARRDSDRSALAGAATAVGRPGHRHQRAAASDGGFVGRPRPDGRSTRRARGGCRRSPYRRPVGVERSARRRCGSARRATLPVVARAASRQRGASSALARAGNCESGRQMACRRFARDRWCWIRIRRSRDPRLRRWQQRDHRRPLRGSETAPALAPHDRGRANARRALTTDPTDACRSRNVALGEVTGTAIGSVVPALTGPLS